jgi:Flp pilus assembly pilin Flp
MVKLRPVKGQALTEYVMIIAVAAIFCIAGVRIFSTVIKKYYTNITTVYSIPIP